MVRGSYEVDIDHHHHHLNYNHLITIILIIITTIIRMIFLLLKIVKSKNVCGRIIWQEKMSRVDKPTTDCLGYNSLNRSMPDEWPLAFCEILAKNLSHMMTM